MGAILLIGPATEPVSLAEAKNFLRVEHADEDELIARLVVAARAHVEAQTRRVLMAQTWRLTRSAWPTDGCWRLPLAPVREVLAARVYDTRGVAHAIDLQNFVLDAGADPVVQFVLWAVPTPGRRHGGIEIDVAAGYGAEATAVPEPLRHAMRLLLAHWYENRALAASGGGFAQGPAGVDALLAPYRVLGL